MILEFIYDQFTKPLTLSHVVGLYTAWLLYNIVTGKRHD